MFDKLDDLLIRFEELMSELQEPDVDKRPESFQKIDERAVRSCSDCRSIQ